MIGYVRLSIEEAALAFVLLEELENLYTEQLRDEEHPLGEDNQKKAADLRRSIFEKLEKAKSRRPGRHSKEFSSLLKRTVSLSRDIDRILEKTKNLEDIKELEK